MKSRLIGKDPDAGKDWRQEEKKVREGEMVGWYHRFNGCEFEQTLGDSEGQEDWHAAAHGVTELDMTGWLNNNNQKVYWCVLFFKTKGIPIAIQISPVAYIDCVSFPFFTLSPVFTHLGCLSQTDSEFAPRENLFTITHMTSLLHCGSNRERSICCSIYLAHSMCSINIYLLNKNLGSWEFPYCQTWRLGETCALRECGGSAPLLTYLALCISSMFLVLKYILLQWTGDLEN